MQICSQLEIQANPNSCHVCEYLDDKMNHHSEESECTSMVTQYKNHYLSTFLIVQQSFTALLCN